MSFFYKIFLLVIIFFSVTVSGICAPGDDPAQNDLFLNHFDKAVESSRKNTEIFSKELEKQKSAYEELKNKADEGLNKINIYKNLLIVPDVNISALEKSLDEINAGLSSVNTRISELDTDIAKTKNLIDEIHRKIDFASNFTENRDDVKEEQSRYSEEVKNYKSMLAEQEKTLLETNDYMEKQIALYQSLKNSLSDLKVIFEKDIKAKKDVIIFTKEDLSFKIFSLPHLYDAFSETYKSVSQYFLHDNLNKKKALLKEHLNPSHLVISAAVIILLIFFFSLSRYLKKEETYNQLKGKYFGYPIILAEKSIYLIIFIFALEIFIRSELYIVFPDFLKFCREFLYVFLSTRIASDSIKLIVRDRAPAYFQYIFKWRNFFIWGIRGYAFVYLFFRWFVSYENTALAAIRIAAEIFLVIVLFVFWKGYKKSEKTEENIFFGTLEWCSKGIVIAGLLSELAGYRYFTSWWFVSWGRTLVFGSFLFILFQGMQNISQKMKERTASEDEEKKVSHSFYWLFSNGVYFLIILLGITGTAFSWGAGSSFLGNLVNFSVKKYQLGKLELSVSGFVYSLVVIFISYMLINFWKSLMRDRLLKESGLSLGVRESVTTISVYILWVGAILISLNVLGVNTASMGLAFGALGIGLGFGLQNIFNNFISGLILLFERPIKVGDVVEVGGIWGEVEKINVRATIVNTYTNSSLIIPNSEFISAQVTNWSHNDPYVRRDLVVGVSYSSDTDLVEKVMLEAADKVKGIRYYPKKPAVQFINFGDSSLDFRLRFWCSIDDFVEAESRLRFMITQLFRENGIEIPFPQRDLHFKNAMPPVKDAPQGYIS
ncbi:MAG: mechanosensitive ion channel domain-containing protein [Thermodesulfobacteriota bacterium]